MVAKRRSMGWLSTCLEFVRLQLAGNILFIGTLAGIFVAEKIFTVHSIIGVIVGSIVAHIIFFIVNRHWVFRSADDDERLVSEVVRFIAFMTFNFFLNLVLIEVSRRLFAQSLPEYAMYEYYAGLVMSSLFFVFWSYVGLKFWVFAPASVKRHARATRHHALTYEKKREVA